MLFLQAIIHLFPVLQIPPLRFVGLNICCWFCNLYIFFGLLTDSFIYFLSFYLFVIELHQTWDCMSDGTCTRTLRQHSDYVTCLAAAEKNVIFLSNF